jgi:hypothetical protein
VPSSEKAGIVRIFVSVENIGDREFADGDNETVGGLRFSKLVGLSIDVLGLAAKIAVCLIKYRGNRG